MNKSKNQLKNFVDFREVIETESELICEKRKRLFGEKEAENFEETKFGIALSGGGIRSATINLGFLKTLNRWGFLKKADYLSTVSGGGYTGSFIQGTLKNKGDFDHLFDAENLDHLKAHGAYLVPGKGWRKLWNRMLLGVSFFVSLAMSWMSPMIFILLGYLFFQFFNIFSPDTSQGLYPLYKQGLTQIVVGIIIILFVIHFFANVLWNYSLGISKVFNNIKTGVLILAVVLFGLLFVSTFQITNVDSFDIISILITIIAIFLMGFYTNPNALSLHRMYRKQLADAFLETSGENKNILLCELFDLDGKEKDYAAPYPLINTCLNLRAVDDERLMGTKGSDYFLLSPLYCGSKLTRFVATKDTESYQEMTLPTATTISAAAVNPGMGAYSNPILSALTTIFNARLGYWTRNPIKLRERSKDGKTKLTNLPYVWWPMYFIYELFGNIGTNRQMLNISDGGHIENLAVYELLRRRCKLIIAVDAGADPKYEFSDLNNLLIRARNELGLAIEFREDNEPSEFIRPRPSKGFSEKRFSVADVIQVWEDRRVKGRWKKVKLEQPKRVGLFVYIKSSISEFNILDYQELGIPKDHALFKAYKYKTYHPAFPHEPTSDQFFDDAQWEAYFQLGRFLGAEVLNVNLLKKELDLSEFDSFEKMYKHFDRLAYPSEAAMELLSRTKEATQKPEEDKFDFKM